MRPPPRLHLYAKPKVSLFVNLSAVGQSLWSAFAGYSHRDRPPPDTSQIASSSLAIPFARAQRINRRAAGSCTRTTAIRSGFTTAIRASAISSDTSLRAARAVTSRGRMGNGAALGPDSVEAGTTSDFSFVGATLPDYPRRTTGIKRALFPPLSPCSLHRNPPKTNPLKQPCPELTQQRSPVLW